MLTICKVTSTTAGYEVLNDFCLIRNAKKYTVGDMYVCKILNRFTDCHGNDHFAVKPISENPIKTINYALATKIAAGERDGVIFLLGDNCPDDLSEVIQNAKDDPLYNMFNAAAYTRSVYNDMVQDYFLSLAQ